MSQSSAPPPSAVQRVPVFQTMRAAYDAVFGSLGLLFRAAALPFLLSIVVVALSLMAGTNAVLSVLLTVLGFVPYTLFGVAWHRLTLLGPAIAAPVVFPSWHRRHWRFLGCAIAIMGVLYLLWIPVALSMASILPKGEVSAGHIGVIWLFGVSALILVVYLAMRLSFVFPAVAVDEAYTFRDSWVHTRGQAFRLIAALFVTAAPMLILLAIVGGVMAGSLLSDGGTTILQAGTPEEAMAAFLRENIGSLIAIQLINSALSYILMALMIAVISMAFRVCTGWVPAPAGAPPMLGAGGES